MQNKYHFVYLGVQYNASDYVEKHPGGKSFIQNMKNQRKDFTQYFKALHSVEAEKILKSFPIVKISQPSKESKQYLQIFEKIKQYYQPIIYKEVLLVLLVAFTLFTAIFTRFAFLSILLFTFSQILIGWIGHSMDHSRNPYLKIASKIVPDLLGGFNSKWWGQKHNMHHMFANSTLYDDDIKHSYKVYLYPFLYLKWRFDSIRYAIVNLDYTSVLLIIFGYSFLFLNINNILYFIIGQLLAGFYSAYVLIGNHQRQTRFNDQIQKSYIDHQIVTSRNYYQSGLLWLLLMGGMQYQVEHHLFPQIPFYRLPEVIPIIRTELGKISKSISYGSVL